MEQKKVHTSIQYFINFLFDLEQSLLSIHGEAAQPLLTLSETDTIFILSMDSCIVANDATDLDAVKQQNERFIEVIVKNKQYFLLRWSIFSYVKQDKVVIYTVIVV